ncbi:D-glycero-alpha-D-manno-heptose-1,7-bisphosphate 7-phosphatase [Gemmatimonas phototrophica]|uniref:D-glycero-alpha-D-manno-heptose-1,7-bisphosphate 7-phosphatase n=1 Tax=Gemmatimonas phototrophica TaxID=1379270 RepID=UPI0006A6B680|nr:HAD-IIIA family hydrolase [Gemmatimonas phototrophica]
MAAEPSRGALFIDRDGTIIADAHYLADPSGVRLLRDAVAAVSLANRAQVPVVIVTNQSGIARGLITEAQYQAVRDRTVALLQAGGAEVLTTYHCPHLAELTGACNCRKPALGMYEQASREHGFDLAQSAYIGDRWRDAQPALATGGLGILVPGAETPASDVDTAHRSTAPNIAVSHTLLDAVMLALTRLGVGDLPEHDARQNQFSNHHSSHRS